MTYLRVGWKHNSLRERVIMYSEIDDERWELRKVYIYSDGSVGYADAAEEIGGVGLGEKPIPSLAEISHQAVFESVEISKGEFEAIWNERVMKPIRANRSE